MGIYRHESVDEIEHMCYSAVVRCLRGDFMETTASEITDVGAPHVPHGKSAMELNLFVNYGASEMEAILAAA